MEERTAASIVIVLVAIGMAAVAVDSPAATVSEIEGPAEDPDRIRILDDADGSTLAEVSVTVAETPAERQTGLSEHESLPAGTGMWFVFDREAERTFVMHGMNFSIDMLFVGSDGRITEIHRANVSDSQQRYRGRARWVLEVNYGFATDNSIEAGDRVVAVGE
jgi:uncharacterized membrane protein (UPF0127 family)